MSEHPSNDQLWGHPKGLYVCFATEMWERFSFYGMKYLLLLYLTKYHLFTDAAGFDVLGAYAGLVYALPLIGGLLAGRYLGTRKAVVFGALLLTAGHATMAYEGAAAVRYEAGAVLSEPLSLVSGTVIATGTTLTETLVVQDRAALGVFFLALALITVGVGFLKPNISTLVGALYSPGDRRRDAGFTIFYMGINVGAFIATLLCGYLGETYGWRYGFGAAGIGMLLGLATFLWGQKHLHGHAEPPDPARLRRKVLGPLTTEWLIYACGLLSLVVVWWIVQREPIIHLLQNSLLIVAVVGLILYSMMFNHKGKTDWWAWGLAGLCVAPGWLWAVTGHDLGLGLMLLALVLFIVYGYQRHDSDEYSRTVVLMVLITSTIVFWSLFEQAGGSMTLYADRVMDRNLWGVDLRASQFASLNAFFIILLAIPMAGLWLKLARRGREPSTPVKISLGIMQAGLGFGALVLAAYFPNEDGKVWMIWLVLAYLLHTTGELCLSPVGLSAVTKLSIPRVVGVSMGTWFLATALSETVATRLAKMAAIPQDEEARDVTVMLANYTQLYEFLMWLGLGTGLVLLAVSPLLKKAMRGVH